MNLLVFLLGLGLWLTAVVGSDPETSTSIATLTLTTDVPSSIPSTVSVLVGSAFTSRGVIRTTSLPTATITQISTTVHVPHVTTSPVPVFVPPHLDTHVNAAFGIGGVLLILTGLPMTFYGHKNRWSSFFLVGFYTTALMTLVLILRFGVMEGVKPPTTKLEGIFLLASAIAGFIGGVGFVFFWMFTRYLVGGWGGFALALWIQSFHSNGLIKPMLGRWGFYIATAVVAFCLCTIPKIHLSVLLASTAIVGSTAFMLGVDCFTTTGLKEFYLSNLGFVKLFPVFEGGFPVSQVMTIEIALVGAIALMGAAVQLRFLDVLRRRMAELRRVEQEEERAREEKAGKRFEVAMGDRELWEREHGTGTPFSGRGSEDLEKGIGKSSGSGMGISLPSLSFGGGTAADLAGGQRLTDSPVEDSPEIQERLRYLEEIRQVRESITALRTSSSTPMPSVPEHEHVRTTSTSSMPLESLPMRPLRAAQTTDRRRTRSLDAATLLGPTDPLDLSKTLKIPEDPDKMHWDDYAQDRRLYTPPAGRSPPIPYSEVVPASPAVAEALERRRLRESIVLDTQFPEAVRRTSEIMPSAAVIERRRTGAERIPKKRSQSFSGIRHSFTNARDSFSGVRIIPDPPSKSRRQSEVPSPTKPVRNVTLGELDARHKEKIRALQEPITSVERERVQVDQARARWERNKALEKEEMSGRRKSVDVDEERRARVKVDDWHKRQSGPRPRSRGMDEMDRAAIEPSSSRSSPKDQVFPSSSSRNPAPRHERRPSSRSLDAWNAFTSPGTSKPAPN